MINLLNVEKAFSHGPAETYVLRRIDFDIEPGEFVSIMGPSGADKSTLLHILGMHDQSWAGKYFFDDVAVHKLDTKNGRPCAIATSASCFKVISCSTIKPFSKTWSYRFPIARSTRKSGSRLSVTRSIDFRSWERRVSFPVNCPVVNSNSSASRARS